MTEVVTVNYSGKRETERALLPAASAVAAGFSEDGTLVLDVISDDSKRGVRIRISAEDVASQRHVFADWANRRQK